MSDTQKDAGKPVQRLGYGISEAAESIGCSPGHIRHLIERGELKSAKVGRRRIVRAEDLQAFLAEKSQVAAA